MSDDMTVADALNAIKPSFTGGKRRVKKTSSKKGSKKLSQDGGKRRVKKTSSKKGSKKLSQDGGKRKSKKGSRKQKREMPKPMQDVMEIKNKIKADNKDVKDGPGLTTVVWGLYKGADNDSAKALDKYKSIGKEKFVKMVEDKIKEMAAKRAAKKA